MGQETSLRQSGIRARLLDELGQPLSAPEEARQLVRKLLADGPEHHAESTLRLCMLGEAGLYAVAASFPGPLWCARGRETDAKGAAPLVYVMTQFGALAIPHVAKWLEHDDPDTRYCAALVASNIAPRHALSLVVPLVDLLVGVDEACRGAAVRALGLPYGRGPQHDVNRVAAIHGSDVAAATLLRLQSIAEDTTRLRDERVFAIAALSELRDHTTLALFIDLLGASDRAIGRTAHLALRRLTAHDLGTLPGPWRGWAAGHGQMCREQWLTEALADRRPDLRIMALAELSLGTGLNGIADGLNAIADGHGPDEVLEAQQLYANFQRRREGL